MNKLRPETIRKPNQVRVGNLIKDGNYIEVITWEHIKALTDGRVEFDGIKLTEEWLKKLGFINYEFPFIYSLDNVQILYEKGSYWFQLFKSEEVAVNHIHQLQNLYYSLSGGKELTIKQQ